MLTKVHLVKAIVFLVVMYGCESWTIKKAECQRNDAFKLCWRRLLGCKEMPLDYKEMPLDYKETQSVHLKGNHPWKFIGRTDAEAEAPILMVTWYKELTHWKRPWSWERLRGAGEGSDRGWLDDINMFSSIQLLVCVWLFETPWSAAHTRPPCPSPTPRVYSNSWSMC